MKAPTVLGSLLALAGTVATAESADASVLDVEIPDDLREAVCYQDWYKAIEVSSTLIVSSNNTPDERQTLLDLRRKFYTYVKGGDKSEQFTSCDEKQPSSINAKTNREQSAAPRFSNSAAGVPGRYCYQIEARGYVQEIDPRCSEEIIESTKSLSTPSAQTNDSSSVWTVGTRVEGNSIKGKLLNNGLTTANDVKLTIRSQKDDRSETVKTVAIDAVSAWSETEFVATFNQSPRNWMIEQISFNY